MRKNEKYWCMRKDRKYWYFTDVEYCVLCGREVKNKERRYTPKPKDPAKRTVWRETACQTHFI